jgi:A/G-specific adenine glycosylase
MNDRDIQHLQQFGKALINWHEGVDRPMPWKGEKDPYLIWLSEIILQQTRVEQGLPYFEHFKTRYPNVQALAKASNDEIMKSWEGLGYYSRARNLHAAAKYVVEKLGGVFPDSYEGLLQLKGVGPYTAAAIASFAYDLPHAVLDGNVFRVLSRYLGLDIPIDSTAGKKKFKEAAQVALTQTDTQPSVYNQAMMDFGALQCKPRAPLCESCPMSAGCRAYLDNKVGELPVKAKRIKKRPRYFYYLVLRFNGKVLLHKRAQKDIWHSLYEFPLVEFPKAIEQEEGLRSSPLWASVVGDEAVSITHIAGPYQQALTHQMIYASFWEIDFEEGRKPNSGPFIEVEQKNLAKFAFPKIIDCYLQDKSLYLKLL